MDKPVVLAVSGASGAVYAKDLFERLHEAGIEIHLVITDTAKKIMRSELGITEDFFDKGNVTVHDNSNLEVPIASGSFLTAGMVVAPCSMGCLGRIASGVSATLIERAADVHLKERRPLILVARETPLSDIHLENMLRLSRAGATIMPASPAFTHGPKTIGELSAFITA
ncbi:MAG: UbiX family flavin prenyltransferase, partial [Nitrospinota bacterium]